MIFSEQLIQEIKDKLNIIDIVLAEVKITKRGNHYFGLCPFHAEKTPSFSVNHQKQSFTCFGCGASGDIIEFIKRSKNMTFPEAVEYLAEKAGIEVEKLEYNKDIEEYSNIKALNNYLVSYYNQMLFSDDGKIARNYLKKRKIDESLWNIFSLGFCYDRDNTIYNTLKTQGFTDKTIQLAGIFNSKKTPMLNTRLIFPIFNSKNECIGFGGRTLNSSNTAKYINSPETPIFKKRKLLYNANLAFLEKSPLIITEGYFDVISMYKRNIRSVVAPLGTAISEDQIKLCWKHCDEPIVAFDGDEAGLKAAFRLIETVLPIITSNGQSFKFLILKDGNDLDEIANNPSIDIHELINATIPMKEMLLTKYISTYKQDTPEQRALLFKSMRDELYKIKDNIIRSFYIESLKNDIFSKKLKNNLLNFNKVKKTDNKIPKYLFALVLTRPEILENIFEKFSTITYMKELRDTILTLYTEGEENIVEKLKEMGYSEMLLSILTDDILFHTMFAKKCELIQVINEWNTVYHKNYEEKSAQKYVCDMLKNNFSDKQWELLKHLKGSNKCQ